MGRANPLYGANFTDPRMPIFYPYPGLTDGSLGLLDAYEVDENFNLSATGTDISTTPNLAAIPAATLTGVSQADLDFKGNDSNLLIVFYVQIMPDDFVMQLHRF
ncbi:TPA: hypothetical protein MDS36_002213 [Klebsiella pneumoniae]|nr:hypothetical protein [Klebsiella pneumoniae]